MTLNAPMHPAFPNAATPPPVQEPTLRSYLQVVWRRRWAVAVCFAVVMLTTAWVTLRTRPIYQATAVLEVQKSTGGGLSLEEMFADQVLTTGVTEAVNTEMEVLKSRQVAHDAVRQDRLQLVLDRSERVYRRLLRRLQGMIRGLMSRKEEEGPAPDSPEPEPLRAEALDMARIRRPVQYHVVFHGAPSFTLVDEEGRSVAQGLMGQPCTAPFLTFRLHGSPPPKGTVFPLTLVPLDEAVLDLQSNLEVSPIRNSRLIRLAVTAGHPEDAQRLLASVVSAYSQRKLEQKTKMASEALKFIDQRMDAIDVEMRQAVEALKEFKEEHQLVDLSESVRVAIDHLVELDKSQQEIETLRQQASFILSGLDGEKALDHNSLFALGNALEQPLVAELATELSGLQAERAALRSQYTDRYPRVRALDQKVLKLKGKIRGEIQSLISTLDAKEETLAREVKDAEGRLKRLPEREQRLAELTRRAKVYEDTSAFLLQKKGEIQVTRASQLGDVWVVDPPYADPRSIKPRLRRNGMLAVVVALMLGVGLAFFLEYLDDSVKNAGDVQTVVPLPVLGTIGHHMINEDGRRLPARHLPFLEDVRSQMGEAFRTFRSNLLFTGVDQPRRLMLFTSPLPAEGKTTCAANLGVALSHMGKRVLLVDSDLRKPVLHATFQLKRSPGLVNVLVDDDWEETLEQAVQTTQVPHLDVLASGGAPPNPNEMLGSEKMGHVIDAVARRYDYVLFDTPPVLAMSDAMVLAQRLDGVVLVVRGGRTTRAALKGVVDLLRESHTEILGVVLNDVDFKRERYYYYYSYSHYYAYGEQDSEGSRKFRRKRRKKRDSEIGRE